MKETKLTTQSDALGVLKMSGLISNANDALLNRLVALATEAEFEPDETIIIAQEAATRLYVIEEGLSAILMDTGSDKQLRIQTATKYDLVGWSAIIPQYRYQFMVKAIEKTKALVFNGNDIRNLCQNDHDLGYAIYSGIIGIVAQRLHNAYLQIIGIT